MCFSFSNDITEYDWWHIKHFFFGLISETFVHFSIFIVIWFTDDISDIHSWLLSLWWQCLCHTWDIQAIASQWASCQIRKIVGCACTGNAGNVFPRRRLQRKSLVSDPGMHHGTCITHVLWCMSGSLTGGGGEKAFGIPSACAPAILRIW